MLKTHSSSVLTFKVVDQDDVHIQQALEFRRSYGTMPESDGSDEVGATIAEICRAYLDYMGQDLR